LTHNERENLLSNELHETKLAYENASTEAQVRERQLLKLEVKLDEELKNNDEV